MIESSKTRKHARSKWRNANTGSDKQDSLVFQEILTGTAEWAINHDPRQVLVERSRLSSGNNHTSSGDLRVLVTARILLWTPFREIASQSLGESSRKITSDADMDGQEFFFRSAGEGEGVPLEVGHFGTADEDILACTSRRLLLLDLNLHDIGRVLNDLVDDGEVPGADLTEDTLEDPDNAANKPVTLFHRTLAL